MTAFALTTQTVSRQVVRNLPAAHNFLEFWRKSKFRSLLDQLVALVMSVDPKGMSDEDLDVIIGSARMGLDSTSIYLQTLKFADGSDMDYADYLSRMMSKLRVAIEGLEMGLPADPANRPTREELLERLNDMLEREPLNLSDHKHCEPAGRS